MQQKNFTIVANGEFLPREIILECCLDATIVAVDGAGHKLLALGIHPNVVVGDFDSVELKQLQQIHIPCIPTPDQQFTDLEKAIVYADEQGANLIHLVCATGGRLDHHEYNLRLLRKFYQSKRPICLHTSHQSVQFLRDEKTTILGQSGDAIGVFAYPQGRCQSHGLKYDMHDFPLTFGQSESVANKMVGESASLLIEGEAIVFMPPLFASQRAFHLKSRIDQLAIYLRDARAMGASA